MALHDPPIEVPFIDMSTGMVTEPWQQWLIINKRDKANRVEGAISNNIAVLDANGHPTDSLTSLPTGDIVGSDSEQTLSNKSFAELLSTKILASNGSGGLSETNLSSWIYGTSGRITVTDNGDGTVTLTVPLKSSFGITSDANGLSLKQQANVADSSTSHSVTDPADTPASVDALRDDLVANTIPSVESHLNALGTSLNAILALLLASEIMASP